MQHGNERSIVLEIPRQCDLSGKDKLSFDHINQENFEGNMEVMA